MKSFQTVLLSILSFAVAGSAFAQATSPLSPSASGSTGAAAVVGPAEAWSAKPVGAYRVTLDMPGHPVTMDVTLKDVNGKLVANVWPVGDYDGHDMDTAEVKGNDLVVSGQTARGFFALTLEHRGSAISGTWQLGEQKGPVSGNAK